MSFVRLSSYVCTHTALFIPDAVSLTRFLSIDKSTAALAKSQKVDGLFKVFLLRDFIISDREADQKEKPWKKMYADQITITRNIACSKGIRSVLLTMPRVYGNFGLSRTILIEDDRRVCVYHHDSNSKTIMIFNNNNKLVKDIKLRSYSFTSPIVVPGENEKMMACFVDNTLIVHSLHSGEELHKHEDFNNLVSIKGIYNMLFGIDMSKQICVVNVKTGDMKRLIKVDMQFKACFDVRSTRDKNTFQFLVPAVNASSGKMTTDFCEMNIETGDLQRKADYFKWPDYSDSVLSEVGFAATKVCALFKGRNYTLFVYEFSTGNKIQELVLDFKTLQQQTNFTGASVTLNNFRVFSVFDSTTIADGRYKGYREGYYDSGKLYSIEYDSNEGKDSLVVYDFLGSREKGTK